MNWIPLILVTSLTVVPLARADDFYVNKTADTADGSCDVTDCSLREAIIASNATSGADINSNSSPASWSTTASTSPAKRDENSAPSNTISPLAEPPRSTRPSSRDGRHCGT